MGQVFEDFVVDIHETPDDANRRNGRHHREPTPTQRALGLLVRREHSRKELARKLAVRGVGKNEASAAIDTLTQAGWQDDARFAESLARARAAAGYGPARIRAELATHGIDAHSTDEALLASQADWNERARALLARRFTPQALRDPRQRRKAIDLLLRRGFERSLAFAIVGERGRSDDAADGDETA